MCTRSKYGCLFFSLIAIGFNVHAQQAGVTLVGSLGNSNEPVEQTTNVHDFINNDNNPYLNNVANNPPSQQQMADLNSNTNKEPESVEPSLENGFHMRFQVESGGPNQSFASSGYMSSGSGKTPKHAISMTERSFNAKKKIRSVLPKHHKKYRPHLCGRF
jgi:hypothetical protein